jgi:hypothetical protein
MEHKELIQFIRNIFNQRGFVILPSTSMSEYETLSDWEIGCKRHIEMSEIYEVIKEFLDLKKTIVPDTFSDLDSTSEQKTAKILTLIEKYKIQKIIISATGQEIYLDH